MSEHILKTIEDLEGKLAGQEQAVRKTKSMINDLCELIGQPAKYDLGAQPTEGGGRTMRSLESQIKSDQFFGQPLSTVIGTVLELRKSVGDGPTEVKEIYRLLKLGGYRFNTSDDANNITGLWVSISKNSKTFVKLPSGLVGLCDWYPNMKKPTKARGERDEQPGEEDGAGDDATGTAHAGAGDQPVAATASAPGNDLA